MIQPKYILIIVIFKENLVNKDWVLYSIQLFAYKTQIDFLKDSFADQEGSKYWRV